MNAIPRPFGLKGPSKCWSFDIEMFVMAHGIGKDEMEQL